jgi:hypothetical protein
MLEFHRPKRQNSACFGDFQAQNAVCKILTLDAVITPLLDGLPIPVGLPHQERQCGKNPLANVLGLSI